MFTCTAPAIQPHFFASSCPYKKRRFSSAHVEKKPEVKCQILEDNDEYIVELKTQVAKETIQNFVMSHIRNYQDTIPKYRVVTDWFGNQYYVENEIDQDIINRKALRNIDWKKFSNRVGKKLFSDYQIELNHNGTKLLVKSDKHHQKLVFNFNQEIDDVQVASFRLSHELDSVVLRLRLLKKISLPATAPQPDLQTKTISHTIPQAPTHEENKEKLLHNQISSHDKNTPVSTPSPVHLEEVEDEETIRWQRALSKTPTGHSILEDA